MNGRKYEDLEPWEKAFYDLNMKIGNDAWGARLEKDKSGKYQLRIFVNNMKFIKTVLDETQGKLAGYSLIFNILDQKYCDTLFAE